MRENFVERRKYPRLNFHIPIRYRKIGANAQEFKGSLIKDISEGGAKMTVYEFLPLNLRLAMEIPLVSGTRPVQGTCRVAWVNKTAFNEQYDVGLEFINLDQKDTGQIAKFIFNRSMERTL